MVGVLEVVRGVPIRRTVAAADVSAGQAQPQVNPSAPHLQALLAALGLWWLRLDVTDVLA